MKKMKWKEIYEKCNHNKYSQVTNILRKYSISSNIKNFLNNYSIILLTCSIILLALLIYTFRNNLIIVLYCMLLCLFIFAMYIFYSTYNICLGKDKLTVKINLQNTIIPYNKLGNIYIYKKKSKSFFIPIYYYNLVITYFLEEDKMNIISFPVIMLNKNEVISFFKSFEVKSYKNEEEENEQRKKDKKIFYKALGIVMGIIFIILLLISLFTYFIK